MKLDHLPNTSPLSKVKFVLQYKRFLERGRPSREQAFKHDLIADVQRFIVENYCEECFVGDEPTAGVQCCGRDNSCVIPELLEVIENI